MPACEVGANWSLVTEDRDAVIAALQRGQCDGLVPAASEFMDDFAEFLHERGVLGFFEQFPDGRQRRSIGPEFFCNTLLHKALFRLDSLAQIGPVLFHSPDVLRRGSRTNNRPCAWASTCARSTKASTRAASSVPSTRKPSPTSSTCSSLPDLEAHQRELAAHLIEQCPALAQSGVAMLDATSPTWP